MISLEVDAEIEGKVVTEMGMEMEVTSEGGNESDKS